MAHLNGRFDDHIDPLEVVICECTSDAAEHGVRLFLLHAAFLDAAGQVSLDAPQTRLQAQRRRTLSRGTSRYRAEARLWYTRCPALRKAAGLQGLLK